MQSSVVMPPVVSRILLPVDGSEHARRAAEAAIQIASEYKASLLIVSVVSPPAFFISGPVGAPADLTDYYRLETEDASSAVNSVAELAKQAGVSVTSQILRPGKSVVEAIVEFASDEKVDLIVIGTRGLGGFRKMLLGSVSSGVISHAHCSVLVVR
ncbi:MAG: universal stress protein [Nitrososphaerota archaeon]|nr:universal stress protein [Nitrososphaerota archaeon]